MNTFVALFGLFVLASLSMQRIITMRQTQAIESLIRIHSRMRHSR